MNRKIKFRYWNDVTKQMVNDPPMPYKDGWTIEQLFSDRGWVWMQFTGLKSKSGVEIYEGDVIDYAFRTKDSNERFISSVFWGEYMWLTNDHSINRINDVEIIGNIYENPELLN